MVNSRKIDDLLPIVQGKENAAPDKQALHPGIAAAFGLAIVTHA